WVKRLGRLELSALRARSAVTRCGLTWRTSMAGPHATTASARAPTQNSCRIREDMGGRRRRTAEIAPVERTESLRVLRRLPSVDTHQQRPQHLRVDRFDQMVVEARLRGSSAVCLLTEAGGGDQWG